MGIRIMHRCWMGFFCNVEKEGKRTAKSSCETCLDLFQEKNALLIKQVLLKIKLLQIVKPQTFHFTQQANFCSSSENYVATIYYTILNKVNLRTCLFDDKMAAQIFRNQQVLETDSYNLHHFCLEIFIF